MFLFSRRNDRFFTSVFMIFYSLLYSALKVQTLYDCDVVIGFRKYQHLVSKIEFEDDSEKEIYLQESDFLSVFCNHSCIWIISVLKPSKNETYITCQHRVLNYDFLSNVTGDYYFKVQAVCRREVVSSNLEKLLFKSWPFSDVRIEVQGPHMLQREKLLPCHDLACTYSSMNGSSQSVRGVSTSVLINGHKTEKKYSVRNIIASQKAFELVPVNGRIEFQANCSSEIKMTIKSLDHVTQQTYFHVSEAQNFIAASSPVNLQFKHIARAIDNDSCISDEDPFIFSYANEYACYYESWIGGKARMEVSDLNFTKEIQMNNETGMISFLPSKSNGSPRKGFIQINCSLTAAGICTMGGANQTYLLINERYIPFSSDKRDDYVSIMADAVNPVMPTNMITCKVPNCRQSNGDKIRLKIYYPGQLALFIINSSSYTLPWWFFGANSGYLTAHCEIVSNCNLKEITYGEKRFPIFFPVIGMNTSYSTANPLPRNKWVICNANGFPAPVVTWYILGTPDSGSIDDVVVDKEGFYISSTATGGIYTMQCTAYNENRSLRKKFVLNKSFKFTVPRSSLFDVLPQLSFATQFAFTGTILILIFMTGRLFLFCRRNFRICDMIKGR